MLTSIVNNQVYKKLCSLLIFLVLIGLPLTSFPLLSRLTGAMVAPFSAIPLALLMGIWLVPYLIRRGKFPAEVIPLIYFVLVAILISALAFFLDGYYSRGRDFFDQSIRALITMAIGLSFYFTLTAYHLNFSHFRNSLIYIYIGGGLLVAWSVLETILLQIHGRVQYLPEWVLSLRSKLAFQSPSIIYVTRVSGFAYEPSWFVQQFTIILFPLWISAVFQRKSLIKFRLWKFQIEDVLLLFGLIVFAFSSPRIGLLAFLASLAYPAYLIIKRILQTIYRWFIKINPKAEKRKFLVKAGLTIILVTIFLTITFGAIAGYIQVASSWDYRFALILEKPFSAWVEDVSLTETDIILIARQLAFYERVIYWFGGWHIFNAYPFGVGLGNAGFYIVERMSGLGYGSFEIRDLIYRVNHTLNIKAYWIRLLAETGIIGFTIYLVWLYLLWRGSSLMQKSRHAELQIVGFAGKLFLLAYLLEGFSVDSFAIAYPWVMLALISAGGFMVRKELSHSENNEPTSTPSNI